MSDLVQGYYRSPTLSGDAIVFVSEDDLWTVPREGGVARRLTSGLGRTQNPALSFDGEWLAFTSTEEGHSEIYLMPADGGSAERLTFLGHRAQVIGWAPSGEILFTSNHQQPFPQIFSIYAIDPKTHQIRLLPTGPGAHLSFAPDGKACVLARHGVKGELAYWKRYRGGTAGEIWIDRTGKGEFKKFIALDSNTARPFWIDDRVYFISDHEGIGNVYSATIDGSDLRRHTENRDFYVRGLNSDGRTLIYHSGGDLWLLATTPGAKPRKVEIEYRSPRTQLNRKFVSAYDHLEDYELHPKAERVVIAARGKTFSFDVWKGPTFQHGQSGTFRHRLGRFLNDGKRIVLVSDAGGEESLEIHEGQNRGVSTRLSDLNLGRVLDMKLSPVADEALIVNHRNELVWVDLVGARSRVLDRSTHSRILGFNWSHDGRFVAYSRSVSDRTCAIHVCEVATGEVRQVTEPVLRDVSPYFDPRGEFLYFLSYREFDPVYDNMHFDLGFPRGSKPFLLTLRKDVVPPFSPDYPGRGADADRKREDEERERGKDKPSPVAPDTSSPKSVSMKACESEEPAETEGKQASAQGAPLGADKAQGTATDRRRRVTPLEIDFDGIEGRIVPFPVPEGRYRQIAATDTKVFFTRMPLDGALKNDRARREPEAKAILDVYDFVEERTDTLINGISSFRISQDGKQLIYRAGNNIRLIRAGEKIGSASGSRDETGKKSGWIDLSRVQIDVRAPIEWRQMYREAWRLQRDHFWTEDMSKVDWVKIYEQYLPLLDRIATRSELSDLLWEMQGELGTSHAYEMGGDYRSEPYYTIGFLGGEWEWDENQTAWKVTRLLRGDAWDNTSSSPLTRAGICLSEGDWLLAIDGQPLSRDLRPEQCLVHKARRDVSVTVKRRSDGKTKTHSLRTLGTDTWARYRDWVEANRRFVHEKSGGRVGYVHIPDMGPWGYAEFHRYFLVESERAGLIVDVRFNGGGHVSQLLLEKLARRRIGYQKSRWFGTQPYPEESAAGPMVALTNEYAGSDGDIFSHSFKLLRLGPLIGKRTWGGVIGISPSHSLTDGAVTTQPEYSFWFEDVGWKVENYGTEPDIEVEFTPCDHIAGRDPQLERGVQEVMRTLERAPVKRPVFEHFPDRSPPELSF